MLMKARLELNKTRHLQIGVAVSKKKAKKIISEELEKETDPKALTELCKDL